MSTDLIQQPQRIPLVDSNGLITREWSRFMQALYIRVGGPTAPTNNQISSSTDMFEVNQPDPFAQIGMLRKQVSNLELSYALTPVQVPARPQIDFIGTFTK